MNVREDPLGNLSIAARRRPFYGATFRDLQLAAVPNSRPVDSQTTHMIAEATPATLTWNMPRR